MNKIIFTTPRLEAHLLTKENQNLLIELYDKKENREHLKGLSAFQDIELTFDCYEQNDIGAYLIFCNQTKNFIGFGGVQNQEPLNDGSLAFEDAIEFLIMIDASHGGKGYAKEFSSHFINYFFENSKLKTIPARVSKENFACIKLLKGLGFQDAGEVPYHEKENKFHFLKIKR